MDQKVKELDIQGCRTFVCPNLSMIGEKCKELNLKEDTTERAKNMAVEYFKKTYHMPRYSSAKRVLPAFIYVACVLEGEKMCQTDVAKVFGTSHSTIRRWYLDIVETLDIDMKKDKKVYISEPISYVSCIDKINTLGKELDLKDKTIERARKLAMRYFEIASYRDYHKYIDQLLAAFIYTASVIENDRRSQLEVCKASMVREGYVSKWHLNILRILGMKIIGRDMHTTAVLEGQYDNR